MLFDQFAFLNSSFCLRQYYIDKANIPFVAIEVDMLCIYSYHQVYCIFVKDASSTVPDINDTVHCNTGTKFHFYDSNRNYFFSFFPSLLSSFLAGCLAVWLRGWLGGWMGRKLIQVELLHSPYYILLTYVRTFERPYIRPFVSFFANSSKFAFSKSYFMKHVSRTYNKLK